MANGLYHASTKPIVIANFEMAYKIVEESGLDPGRIVNLG